jgi:hypothetical protein
MKKVLISVLVLITVLITVTCSKKSSPTSPMATATTVQVSINTETATRTGYTATATATVTASSTANSTATSTVTVTFTGTPVISPTESATVTVTATATGTPEPSPTSTPCNFSFGNYGSADDYIPANTAAFEEYNNPNPALLTGIEIYSLSGGNNVVVAIYDGSGNIVTQSVSTACSSGWNTISVPNEELSAGNYYIGAVSDQDYGLMASSGGTIPVYANFTYGSPFPSTIAALAAGSGGGLQLDVMAICTCP